MLRLVWGGGRRVFGGQVPGPLARRRAVHGQEFLEARPAQRAHDLGPVLDVGRHGVRVDDVPGRLLARVREAGRVAARARGVVAENYALTLLRANRFEDAKSLMLKTMPAARRVFGKNASSTLKMRAVYAVALYEDPAATLDDLREAVTTIEETERTARRVLGGSHPIIVDIGRDLRAARAALRARETPSSSA